MSGVKHYNASRPKNRISLYRPNLKERPAGSGKLKYSNGSDRVKTQSGLGNSQVRTVKLLPIFIPRNSPKSNPQATGLPFSASEVSYLKRDLRADCKKLKLAGILANKD